MAAECTETSVVNPNPNSSAQNWWHEIMHANSLCSWSTSGNSAGGGGGGLVASSNNFPWLQHSSNHSSESSAEDDVSISNQSVLTAESSRQLVDGGAGAGALAGELIGETTSDQNHLWTHFLLSGGSTRGGMEYKSHPQQVVVGEGMLNLSSSSSSSAAAATNFDIMSNCDDYLKKMGTADAYEFNLGNPTTALKDPGGFLNHGYAAHETQRPMLTAVANKMPSPAGMLDHHQPPPMFAGHPCGQLHDVSCICNNNNSSNNHPSRELNDFSASFQSYLSKPLLDINHEYKPTLKTLQYLSSSADYITKKCSAAGLRPSPVQSRASTCSTLTRSHGRGQGILGNEGKKKKLEDNTEKMILKRPKNDNPASKMQVPKVKLADKITALQQIVSPFGKTDTASVLWEAIGHIRFLQEQIQLLTNAYAKSNARKDVPWGGLLVDSRKDGGGGDAKVVDLRSRGLCLVPISYTPQIYRESNASDYLIPTYRGCLYG